MPAVLGVGQASHKPLIAIDHEQEQWSQHALCTQVDPELFFPEKGGQARDAVRVCGECPVTAKCLDYALRAGERFGVWGGLTETQRRAVSVARGITTGKRGGVPHRRRSAPPSTPLGRRLWNWRLHNRITQENAAELLGVSVWQLTSYELGRRNPSEEAMARINQVLAGAR